jgi:hypothetical protein
MSLRTAMGRSTGWWMFLKRMSLRGLRADARKEEAKVK